MVFSSILFLLHFLPIFLLAYHLTPKKLKNYVILLFSIFFYSWGAPKFVFVVVGVTVLNFYLVKGIDLKYYNRKILLIVSVLLNLGLLAYFKYANFFIENVNAVLTAMNFTSIGWTKVALPIGISFYTFQSLTYVVDVYRGVHKPLRKVTDYILYIIMFPQMIAGPIVRFNTIADQIESRNENIDDKLVGFYRFSIGLAKKVLIANVMAEQANISFDGDLNNLTTLGAWIGILAYTFQIYFDFSGYSDMAIGLGKIMGFKFPENFNSPYISTSVSEFWRRWHITLGNFMKDYLYIPLGGNRAKKNRIFFNLWIVFLLSGLWHGASWNFIIWGAYHGLFLILDRLFLIKILDRLPKVFSILITFFIVIIGWVVFRIEDLPSISVYLKKMFSSTGTFNLDTIPSFTIFFILAFCFSFITSLKFGQKLEYIFFEKESYGISGNLLFTCLSLILVLLSVSSITSSGFNPFIYFRF